MEPRVWKWCLFEYKHMSPYTYVFTNGKPVLAPGLVEMLRRQKGF